MYKGQTLQVRGMYRGRTFHVRGMYWIDRKRTLHMRGMYRGHALHVRGTKPTVQQCQAQGLVFCL